MISVTGHYIWICQIEEEKMMWIKLITIELAVIAMKSHFFELTSFSRPFWNWHSNLLFITKENAAQFTNFNFWCRYSIWQKHAIVPCFFSFLSAPAPSPLSPAPSLCVDNSVPFSPSVWTIWIIDDILSGLISKNLIKKNKKNLSPPPSQTQKNW